MYYLRVFAGLAGIVAMVVAGLYSDRFARAEQDFRRGTPEAVVRAIELAPRNTAYLSLGALQIEYGGGDPRPMLQRWAELNPLASAPRIRLGLDAEVRGDFDTAQKWLLEAARVDRQYEPAWTLANFYFRQQNTPEFWKWMRAALEMSYGDRKLAFDLCRQAASEPSEVLTRALPDRHDVWFAYLVYLLNQNETADLAPVAAKLAHWREPSDAQVLYSASDALLDKDLSRIALEIWTALGNESPSGIVNGDFAGPHIGHGFDWRFIPAEGITHVAVAGAHRIVFNGHEPESFELLRQYLLPSPNKRYKLRWEARVSGLQSPTGIEWRIGDQHAPIASSEAWMPGEADVAAPDNSSKDMLQLTYKRPLGEVRADGYIEIRHVTLSEP